jgi:hypothetical protein
MKSVTAEEREQFISFWSNHCRAIISQLSEKARYIFLAFADPDNVGYEKGQVRPGKSGQWDIYYWLKELDCDEKEARIASGLSEIEIAADDAKHAMLESQLLAG